MASGRQSGISPNTSCAKEITTSGGAVQTGVMPVAVARKLAVILHRMWMSQTEFNWSKEVAA
jgi:hypothetical protein